MEHIVRIKGNSPIILRMNKITGKVDAVGWDIPRFEIKGIQNFGLDGQVILALKLKGFNTQVARGTQGYFPTSIYIFVADQGVDNGNNIDYPNAVKIMDYEAR